MPVKNQTPSFEPWRIYVGIPMPEGLDEITEGSQTVEQMRRVIARGAYHSTLIQRVMTLASVKALKDGDTYALLAYYALRALEDSHQREMVRIERQRPAPIVASVLPGYKLVRDESLWQRVKRKFGLRTCVTSADR